MLEEREKRNKQQFRHKFQEIIRQVKELQNETQGYQKTLKQQRKQLHVDFLTKIPNRAAWSERLEIEVSRFKRYQNSLVIAVIDIDTFKKINDTYGHLAGDKVLNVIAQTLQKSIRNTDFIARFGGEEFTLLLPEASQQQAEKILNKLCKIIETIPVDPFGGNLKYSRKRSLLWSNWTDGVDHGGVDARKFPQRGFELLKTFEAFIPVDRRIPLPPPVPEDIVPGVDNVRDIRLRSMSS